ncbi:tape measure protein [Ochrobactrum sp. GPK 3]
MANRDVKLIIRAKNEASRTINSVSEALKSLDKDQAKVGASAAKNSDLISRLGSEFQKLNSQVTGLSTIGKLAGHLERAGTALANLQQDTNAAEGKFRELASASSEAAAETSELEQRAKELSATQKTQKADMEAARKETIRGSEAMRNLAKARTEYNKAVALKDDNASKSTRVAETKAALDAAQAAVQKNVEQYKKLNNVYKETKTESAALDRSIKESVKNQNQLADATANAEAGLSRLKADLAQGSQEFSQLKTQVDGAAKSFGVAATKENELATTIAKLVPEADRLGQIMASLQRYSTGGGNFVNPRTASAMRDQRVEMEKTEATWKTLEGEAKRLAAEMRAVANPTEQQTAAFKSVTAAAKAAKAEYLSQTAALASLQGTAKSTFSAFVSATSPLKQIGQQLEENRKKTDELNAAMQRYSTGSGSVASASVAAQMRQQAEAVEVARKRYELLRAEAQRLDAQLRSGGAATQAQAQQLKNVANAANLAEKEFKEASAAMRTLQQSSSSGVFGSINRESRQAMSVYQRLRGEILSLATAYIGLYGTISNVGGVIKAYQTMEASQNRLGAVFDQNNSKVQTEMGWIQRQANRLGIEFGVLSNEYSKFAVATKAAGFSSEATRKVFLKVAEAGRVNKLSMEQMSLVFLALQQMISKGKIQSEELRQQLGEQLPGAFNIMADAIGVTTEELGDMMKKGEVLANQSNMLKFADELDKRFGPQLAAALRSTTTQLGMFSNNLFQAQVAMANGGFIKSFTDLLKDMNKWFQSEEGVNFFLSLGAAAGRVVDVLRLVFQNMDSVVGVIELIVAAKLAAWLVGVANNAVAASKNMAALSTETRGLATAQNVALGSTNSFFSVLSSAGNGIVSYIRNLSLAETRLKLTEVATKAFAATTSLSQARILAGSAATTVWTGTLALLRGGLAAARVAVTGLFAAFGGPAGIAVAIGTYFAVDMVAKWVGGVNEATSALEHHKNLMNQIVGEYEKAGSGAKDWSNILRNMRLDQLDANVKNVRAEFDKLKDTITSQSINPIKTWFQGWGEVKGQIDAAREKLAAGKISAEEYRKVLENIYAGVVNDDAKAYMQTLIDQVVKLEELEKALNQATDAADKKRLAVDGLRGTISDIKSPIEEMAAATEESANAFDNGKTSADEYKESLDKIKGFIPGLAAEMKKLKDLATIQAEFGNIGFNNITPEMAKYGQQAIKAVLSEADEKIFKEIAGNTKVSAKMFNDIFKEESFRTKAYDDGYGTMTIGYGSTRLNGRAVQAGDTVTKEEGMKQAIADLDKLIAQIESMVKVALSDSQLRALTSYAYNAGIGSLKRDGILAPLNRGDYAGAEAAIRNGVTTSKGKQVPALKARRQREADLFASGSDDPKVVKEIADQKERAAEADRKAAEGTKQRIADQQFEITQQDLKNVGKEREAAIEKAIHDEKAKNPKVSAEELEIIRQQTGALFDKQQLAKAEKTENKEIAAQMKIVNDLEAQRNALIATRKSYETQGNTEKVKEVNAQLAGVNTQLQGAIDKTIAMYQAMGGPGSEAAIAKFQALGQKISAAGDGMRTMAMTAGEMQSAIFSNLESGIINAFDSFAQAVANGEDAIQALGNAFRQFAASFLMEIAKMILKQIMFNALQSISKFITGGIGAIVAHTGGIVGQTVNGSRSVAPGWFAGAVRYHTGGIAGLKPNEVPAILETGEEVLTEQDERHSKNLGKGGGGSGGGNRTKIVNMFDAASFLSESLNSAVGEEVMLNFVRANPAAFKAALG